MPFNGRYILNIAHFASSQGAHFEELIELTGKSAQELSAADCQVEDSCYNAVIEKAIEDTQDSYFGLHVGESQSLNAIGLIGQITQVSQTVKQALEYCCQFANLGCSALPMSLEERADHYRVVLTPNPLWTQQSLRAVQHTAEGVLTFILREFHTLTRQKYRPITIELPWPAPNQLSEYARVWGCPTQFNQSGIAVRFEKKHIEQEVVTSNYELLRILVAHAEERSAQLEQDNGFSKVVKQSVIQLVQPAFPTIDQVAAHLNISQRTLQRRLKEEGRTFKEILDELRKEFAVSYLRRPELTVTEVAYLLDYADSSTFARSFKRWMGQSPQVWRSKLQMA